MNTALEVTSGEKFLNLTANIQAILLGLVVAVFLGWFAYKAIKKLLATLLIGMSICFSAASATYYIDSVNGSDANNGLGPDASNGTNKPWKTIAKYQRTNAVSGDTAYLSSAGPFRESVTVLISPTSTTKLIGDPQNVQGFKNSSGVLVPPAIVRWTVMTNDSTASPATVALTMNGSDYWWFENIYFNQAGAGSNPILATTTTSTNLTFTNCIISVIGNSSAAFAITAAFGVPLNLTISNCKIISSGGNALAINHTSGSGSDWNLNIRVENCELIGTTVVIMSKVGSSANVGGGLLVTNSTLFTTSNGAGIASLATSTNNFTNYVTACLIISGNNGLQAGDVSQIAEDYNWINAPTARVVTNTGANSKSAFNPMVNFDASRLFGFGPRPFFSPLTSSPLIGLGTTAETVDLFSKTRPSPNSIGAYELYQNVETSHSFSQ